jgi:hypothetical protein
MKKYILWAAGVASLGAMAAPLPALAFDVSIEHSVCPLESIGETEIDAWGVALAKTNGEMSDSQLESLSAAIASCAQQHKWSEDDTKSVLEFNISIIAATAIADKLTLSGVDAEAYERVLDNASEEDLLQVLNDSENSPVIKNLTDKMIAELGDGLTDQIAGDLGSYIAFMAQAQYSSLKMLGLSN